MCLMFMISLPRGAHFPLLGGKNCHSNLFLESLGQTYQKQERRHLMSGIAFSLREASALGGNIAMPDRKF